MPKELIAPSAGKVILREYQERSLKPNEVRVRSELLEANFQLKNMVPLLFFIKA